MNLVLRQLRVPLGPFGLELDLTLAHRAVGIFGPSGAGKTSLLETLAGLRPLAAGSITLDDIVLADAARRFSIPPQRRRIGYLPQDLALFPHLSVERNIGYGARGSEIAPESVIEKLELAPLLRRSVTALSGGEKQRVALARALLASPRLLLLDEPFTGLDRARKDQIAGRLRALLAEFAIPLIYVSHDRDDLRALCDEVVVLDQGKCVGREPNPAAC